VLVVLPFSFAVVGGMWYFQNNSAAASFSFGDIVNPSWWAANSLFTTDTEIDGTFLGAIDDETDDEHASTGGSESDHSDSGDSIEVQPKRRQITFDSMNSTAGK
jgi:hypothetical protein